MKRLVALLLVISMMFSAALAVTPFDKIQYASPSLDRLERLAEQMEDLAKGTGSLQRLVAVYNEMQLEYEHLYTMYSLATLRQYQNGDDPRYAQEVSKGYQVLTDAFEVMRAATVEMISGYEDEFRKEWGDEVVDSFLSSEAMTEEERVINEKIANLLAEYSTLSMEPMIKVDGQVKTLSDAETVGDKIAIIALWQQRLGEIYLELIKLRKELADGDVMKELYTGYYRAYTPEDARKMEDAVAEILAKVQKKVYNIYDAEAAYEMDLGFSAEELIEAASTVLAKIDPSLAESYQTMKKNKLYDVEMRENKRSGAFCVALPSFETPFLYIHPESDIEIVHTFYHEFGHFNEVLQSDLHHYFPGKVNDMDAAEVMSHALSLMVNGKLDEVFGEENGALMEEYNLYRVLFALVSACAVDEFEQYAFSTENLTYSMLNKKFAELIQKYHLTTWTENTWTQIPHIFESPGYYISYAVSCITSMELWEKYEADPEAGVESYLEAVEHCEEGYQSLLSNAKLQNPFAAPDMLERVRTEVERTLGVLVDTYGHWAETEIDMFVLADVVSGYQGTDGMRYFLPEQAVTRAEFIKLLRGIHTKQAVEPVSESAFADVKVTDWYAPYVQWAVENELVNGVSKTEFAPNNTITRQDMAVILHRYMKMTDAKFENKSARVTDAASIAEYAKEAVSLLRGSGVLNGFPDGSFQPMGTVTRAAAVKALIGTNRYVAYGPKLSESVSTTAGIPSDVPIAARMAAMFLH